MSANLDTLRKTAEAATPGPWEIDGPVNPGPDDTLALHNNDGGAIAYVQPLWDDAEFIATFDPPTVLELIAEIESLRTRFNGMRAGRDFERSRADVNALERMEQRALGAEANVEAALEVSRARLTNIEQAERRASQAVADCKAAEQAVARVREVADAWKSRGEHSMKYSETLQWPVAEAIHEGGADMVNNANLIYRALDGDNRG